LDQEIRSYADMLADQKAQGGMSRQEAKRAARIELGGIEQVKEQVRASRSGAWLDGLAADLRYALRALRRNPGFAAVTVLTLALGIGANAALFSAVNTLLIGDLPYKDADRLMYVSEFWPHEPTVPGPPAPDFTNWHANSRLADQIEAYGGGGAVNLTGAGEPEHIIGTMVTGGFLEMIGLRPELGRNFTDEEDSGGTPVVMLGHRLWQRHFGSSPDVIGRQIQLDGVARTVVGVLPASFAFPDNNFGQELLLPMGVSLKPGWRERNFRLVRVIAHVRSGVTPDALRTELFELLRRTAQDEPPQFVTMRKDMEVRVVPLRQWLSGDVSRPVLVLQAAVGMVLLIGCLNIANLQIARGIARRKEMAVRAALGAGRGRIARQLLTEALLLSFLGGAAGLALAYGSTGLLRRFLPTNVHLADSIRIDRRVLVFTLAIAVLSGILTGLAPFLAAARTRLHQTLKEGANRTTEAATHPRLNRILVIAEIAVAMVLLAGSGLLIRSFLHMASLDPGFDPDGVLTMRVALPERKYATDLARAAFYDELRERAASIPGVHNVAIGGGLPLIGTRALAGVWPLERPAAPPGGRPSVPIAGVSPEYFKTLGIPLIQGRAFTDGDREDSPGVAIVNRVFADRFFPGEQAIGKRISVAGADNQHEIVGIAGNVRQQGLGAAAVPTVYVPYRRLPEPEELLILRSSLPPSALLATAAEAIRAIDPDVPVYDAATMQERLREALSSQRANMTLMGALAALALALAAVGIFGVIAYLVNGRSLEFGIRMALGAQHRDVLKMVLGHGLILALAGIAIGLGGALAATRALRALLFEVSPSDPSTLVASAVLFAVVAAAACYIPARRAVRVDPMTTLRHD
jgi:putative ABC transport system permease protein